MYMYVAPRGGDWGGRNTKFHRQCPVELVTTKSSRCCNGMSPGHCDEGCTLWCIEVAQGTSKMVWNSDRFWSRWRM